MLELIVGAIIISFSAVFVKLTTVEPTVSAFYRMFFGALVLAVLILIRRESIWFGWRTAGVIVFAALCFAGDLFFWHRSILFVGPGLATLLANFQVFVLALAGWFWFRDPLRWETALSIPLAMIGLSLLIGADWLALSGDYRTGIVLGLLTAICYGAYILSLRASRVSEIGPSSLGIMALISFYCALILAGLASLESQSLAIPTWRDAGILLVYGIVAQVLGWMMISRGITKVGAAQTGLILLLQPAFSFVWDVAFFARRFNVLEGCGALLALTAIYLGSLRR